MSQANAAAANPPADPSADPSADPIVPDTKDWTWVLHRPCEQCGMTATSVSRDQIAESTREAARRWATVLARPGVTARPAPDVWSPLEYQCHVRDVCTLFDVRLRLMLEQDDPEFDNWDQDATATASGYGQQDPAMVADELDDAARRIATTFAAVRPDQWDRTGRRSDGSTFTVLTLGQYFLHDVYHHLHDVGA